MSDLIFFKSKRVAVITSDARFFEGILEGYDKQTNIILCKCNEIIIEQNDNEDNQVIESGVYIIRGNEIVCIGEIDVDKEIDWLKIKGWPLKGTKNPLK
ncbi:unnamed protein product [Candida verbasci]|uniref:LSM2-LSM8 complex subunit LSM8 n=1 Tax=Candida verbasci TaxID=1227364 RepID=A0A9W4TY83_9ASCO|nr:unnamed protein product [Candida verbasci]